MKLLPRLVRDFPRAIRRAQTRNFKDLPEDVDLAVELLSAAGAGN
jgi:hypothetical protein